MELVSILVLLDDAYRLDRIDSLEITINRVSILVLLDDAYRHWLILNCGDGVKVSILVLLDDAYRPFSAMSPP